MFGEQSRSNQGPLTNGKAWTLRRVPTEINVMALSGDVCVCHGVHRHVADNLLYENLGD